MRRNADIRLRQAERSGDPVQILRERIRAGFVTEEQVRWAARLGHPSASYLCSGEQQVDWEDFDERCNAIEVVSRLVGGKRWMRVAVSHACDMAEHVLHIFEENSPEDDRPRRAIDLVRRWASGKRVSVSRLRAARSAADADAADADAAYYAARAAYYAAAAAYYAASVAAAAADASRVAYYAAYAAAFAAGFADAYASVRTIEHEWQRLRLAQYALGEVVP